MDSENEFIHVESLVTFLSPFSLSYDIFTVLESSRSEETQDILANCVCLCVCVCECVSVCICVFVYVFDVCVGVWCVEV